MTSLYVFWQEPQSRRWHPVGLLSHSKEMFQFSYTKSAIDLPNFVPFGRMTKLNHRYVSDKLFPIFKNRILTKSRPEYTQFLKWIDAENHCDDPLFILARTGGARATDSIMIYPKPNKTINGNCEIVFFAHGVRYTPDPTIDRISRLKIGETLYPMLDPLNEFDESAVSLRTDDPVCMVGYVPRFFAKDIWTCITQNSRENVRVKVVRVNVDAPYQFRLLCKFEAKWPNGFNAFSGKEFELILDNDSLGDSNFEASKKRPQRRKMPDTASA